MLDQGLANTVRKVVRVRIEKPDRSLESSSTVPALTNPDTTPIEELILQARNAVYEEELFHELTRETRILTNQGVHNIDSVIVLALPDRRRVLIDLFPLEDYHHQQQQEQEQQQDQSKGQPQPSLADGIALALRLLLSHAHRQYFLQRSQIPPPLTDRKRPQPPQAIIRPILSHLMHRSVITSLNRFLKGLEEALDSAGLNASHAVAMGTNCSISSTDTATNKPGKKQQKIAEKVVEAFANGVESDITISLPGGNILEVHVRTQLYPPFLGTDYLVTLLQHHQHQHQYQQQRSSSSDGNTETEARRDKHVITRLQFSSGTEMRRYISHAVTLALIEEIKSWSSSSLTSPQASSGTSTGSVSGDKSRSKTEPGISHPGSSSKSSPQKPKESRTDLDRTTATTTWLSTSTFNELTITYDKVGRSKRLQILVLDDRNDEDGGGGGGVHDDGSVDEKYDDEDRGQTTVVVKWGWLSGLDRSGSGSYRWHGKRKTEKGEGDEGVGPKRSLRAVVAEAAQFHSS